jgi:hypothetical protein
MRGRKNEQRTTGHRFTLALEGSEGWSAAREDALFEAGCDDATILVQAGRVYLEFDREAPSLENATLSAIRDVRRAGLRVLRVDRSSEEPQG